MNLLKDILPTEQGRMLSFQKRKGHDQMIEGKYFNLQVLSTFKSQSSGINLIANTSLVKWPRAHTVQLNLVICC